MGSIGGLLGMSGGMGGTGFSTNSGLGAGQLDNSYQGVQNSMIQQNSLLNALNAQSGLQNQSQVYNQLQNVAQGQGPNPAQAMLNQSTGANVANQAALMAGQRGAGANVGLMARQNAQQGGALQQQAAGQGASMQAQQSLGALGQAGQMANTQAANTIGQYNANTAAQQNEQNILQGANKSNNAIQGQMANTQMQGQQALIGGLGNAIGGATGMFKAHGGPIQRYDDGGMVPGSAFGPQSMFAHALISTDDSMPNISSSNSGATAMQKGIGNVGNIGKKKPPTSLGNGAEGGDNVMATGDSQMAAGGGKVQAMVSPGERFLKPNEARAVAEGRADPTKVGEKIPGNAPVKGDSYKNDIVPKKLDVGGIVLPRSVENSKNPGADAKRFVDAYMAKKKVRK